MSERLHEYFTDESSEYLDQLERLLERPGPVDPHHLLRLARGVRGSAQMAGVETIGRVAEHVEDAARSVASHHVVWSDEIRQLAIATVKDLQLLVRALNRWGPEEEARVRAALERWEEHDATIVPISALYHDDEGPHVLSEPDLSDVVPVRSLQLEGDDALREALRLRPRVDAALERPSELRPLLDELFDLLELGTRPVARPG
jgi:HPt (histidine-containing phosphotransfer) domain-containing protein